MASFCRLVHIGTKIIFPRSSRSISLSPVTQLKEIKETKEGNTIIVEGVTYPDKKEQMLIQKAPNGACRLCSTGIYLKHTDVLILSQFLRSDGCMLPRRVTGLCRIQQKRVSIMVAMAQKAGLMSNLTPSSSKKDPKRRYEHRKFNTYFDEKTIKVKY